MFNGSRKIAELTQSLSDKDAKITALQAELDEINAALALTPEAKKAMDDEDKKEDAEDDEDEKESGKAASQITAMQSTIANLSATITKMEKSMNARIDAALNEIGISPIARQGAADGTKENPIAKGKGIARLASACTVKSN
jgi:chromosome segregation ATPase